MGGKYTNVGGKYTNVGGKYTNVDGKWKMWYFRVGGKWSEEYICENYFFSFMIIKHSGAIIAHFPLTYEMGTNVRTWL